MSNVSKGQQVLNNYLQDLTEEPREALQVASALLKEADRQLINTPSTGIELHEPLVSDATDEKLTQGTFNPQTRDYALKERLGKEFQLLFFTLAGIRLALPLVELGGIFKLDKLVPLPGKSKHSLGLLVKNDEKYTCINTAKLVMPERYSQAMEDNLHYEFAVQLGKSRFVLACEGLEDSHEVHKDNIKWREFSAKNAWLAGTVKDKMCALIDAEQLIKVLSNKLAE